MPSECAATMRDDECIVFLQWALPRLRLRWPGFRKVHRQVCKRLRRRLVQLGLETPDQYRDLLETDLAEWHRLDELCHITISCFYRDKHVFDVLGASVLPALGKIASAQSRPVRCWCAGCASGEEVFTLKIMWDLQVEPTVPQTPVEVIGTDVEDIVLQRAQRGCFSEGSLRGMPPHWRERAFTLLDRQYCVRDIHRKGITFVHQDIRTEFPPGAFDLILCRNLVFTYFEPALQRTLLGGMASVLRAGGYFVIGAHEQLPQTNHAFNRLAACREIYQKV
jgi:chemotaxis protein methyltransferase CheR